MAKMTHSEMVAEVMTNFRSTNSRNKELQLLLRKVRSGKGSQRDMASITDMLGDSLEKAMQVVYHNVDDYSPAVMREMADKTVKPCLEQILSVVNDDAIRELRYQDKKYGINIGIRKAGSADRIDDVAGKIATADSEEHLAGIVGTDVKTLPRKFYDDFQRTNAELREELGYDQIIIRTYDDIGLHDRTTPCQFCLSRQGTWEYQDAISRGVFQRHPGCHCNIEMITNKNTRLTQTQWQRSVDADGNEIRGTGNQWT